MKKVLFGVVAVVVLMFVVNSFAGVIIARKVDKIIIGQKQIILQIGEEKNIFPRGAKAGIRIASPSSFTIFIKKDGENCSPYYEVSMDMYLHLEKQIDFSIIPDSSSSSAFCNEGEKPKDNPKAKTL